MGGYKGKINIVGGIVVHKLWNSQLQESYVAIKIFLGFLMALLYNTEKKKQALGLWYNLNNI